MKCTYQFTHDSRIVKSSNQTPKGAWPVPPTHECLGDVFPQATPAGAQPLGRYIESLWTPWGTRKTLRAPAMLTSQLKAERATTLPQPFLQARSGQCNPTHQCNWMHRQLHCLSVLRLHFKTFILLVIPAVGNLLLIHRTSKYITSLLKWDNADRNTLIWYQDKVTWHQDDFFVLPNIPVLISPTMCL